MKKRSLLLATVLMVSALSACKPKLDTSSEAAFMASYTRMRVSLDENKRGDLDAAILKVASKDLRDKGPIDVAKHLDDIVPNAKQRLEGKTAEEIIGAGR